MDTEKNNKEHQRKLRAFYEGEERSVKALRSHEDRDDLSGHKIVHKTIEDAKDAVVVRLKETLENQSGRKKSNQAVWFKHLNYIDANLAATIALRCCFDSVGANWTLSNTKLKIATSINAAIMHQVLKSSRDGRNLLARVADRASEKSTGNHTVRDRAVRIASRRKKKLLENGGAVVFDDDAYSWTEWDTNLSSKLASHLINCIMETTNFFKEGKPKTKVQTLTKEKNVRSPQKRLLLTDETREWLKDKNREMFSPVFGPMWLKPNKWGPNSFGPYDDFQSAFQLEPVKHMGADQRKAINEAMINGDLDEALEALNLVQETGYTVNEYVLRAIEWVLEDESLERSRLVNGFPNRTLVDEIPNLDKDVRKTMDYDEVKGYEQDQIDVIKSNLEVDANEIAFNQNLFEANDIVNTIKSDADPEDRFYLPHQWDSRGRVYHVSNFGHHSEDYLRALFLIANKTEMNDDNAHLLALQLANTYGNGVDKLSLEGRQAWAEENLEAIYAAGKDYKANFDFWREADEALQFLAACHEFAEYSDHGPGFMSGLPIALDASCSGLQIYAAMGRNQEDGEKVNLTKSKVRHDLYEAVQQVVQQMLEDDSKLLPTLDLVVTDEDDDEEKARKVKNQKNLLSNQQWMAFGVTRKHCKRSVMTWAYSSRRYGFAEQIRSDVMEDITKELRYILKTTGEVKEHPFGKDKGHYAAWYLAGLLETAIESVVKSAKDGMEYFQDVVKLLNEHNLQLHYRTPLNFPVMHNYTTTGNPLRVDVPWFNKDTGVWSTNKDSFQTFTKDVNKRRAVQACSPNLIHSLDATVLMKTAIICKDNGVEDLMVVHDSFATTIGNLQTLAWAVRAAFVETFNDYDPYQAFGAQSYHRIMKVYADKLSNAKDNDEYEALSQARQAFIDGFPEPPEPGSLDLSEVLFSDYAFS